MNIFNRKNDDDDLPGRVAMPRPKLPPVEEQLGELVREQYTKKPLTLDQRREKLDFHLAEFQRHAAAARSEAEIYLAQHVAMMEELANEKVKLEEWQAHLDKLEANLPKFGGTNEQADSDPSLASDDNASTREDPVPAKPLSNVKPLSPNRR